MASQTRDAASRFAWFNRKRIIILSAVVVVVGGAVGIVVATAGSGGKKPAATIGSTVPAVASNLCPLTDTPAPGGAVPRRPALLVKIGNEPEGARPQSGLNEADIVYDTPAEGFIMRYVAVYQCNNATSIGPTRSVRWVDYHMIARPFVTPILAFAGGINPNVDGVANDSSWLSGANLLEGAQAAGVRISSREAPDNLYTSTSSLYAMFKSKTNPPPAVFSYGSAVPAGAKPAASVGINFSSGTDVVWKWDASTGKWLHTYSGTPDIDLLSNQQVSTTNIVIQIVHYKVGPYIESTGGSGDIQSELLGSGVGYVLRNGTETKVTWQRHDELSPTTFTNSSGKPVSLAPGRTWVEIMPDVQANTPGGITFTS